MILALTINTAWPLVFSNFNPEPPSVTSKFNATLSPLTPLDISKYNTNIIKNKNIINNNHINIFKSIIIVQINI